MRTILTLKALIASLILLLALIACGASSTGTEATPESVVTAITQPVPTDAPAPSATNAPSEPSPTPEPPPTNVPSEPSPTPEPPPTNTPSEPTPTLVPLEANTFPGGDVFGDELAFQTTANDLNVGTDNGTGIASVNFQVFDGQGNQVYERTETNARYCAFGGGDNGQDCPVWRFSEHNNTWPNGTPVENGGSYKLQATITANSGQQLTQELHFTINLP